MRTALLLLALTATAQAQWDLQTSNTTASLRGIHALGNGIAWASGSEGTVLHTTDNGLHWQRCTTPPDADKLDFRGIQAFDAQTAIVMSSGKGDLSRLYKTTDACQTWKLLFTNPDKDGFWDALLINRFDKDGYLVGDPVNGLFRFWTTGDKGETWQDYWQDEHWKRTEWKGLEALPKEGAFAASNSSLLVDERYAIGFVTGGPQGGRLFLGDSDNDGSTFHAVHLPLSKGSEATGAFAIESRDYSALVVVGGNYQSPNESLATAAYSRDGGEHWTAATTPPHGYRSAVAYSTPTKTWITVGPNGTDISTDDGRNWRALKPLPGQPDDADQHWNALSLPFAVGPHGRIGILNPAALKPQ